MEAVKFTVDGSDIVPKVPLSSHLCDMIVIACLCRNTKTQENTK